MNVAMPAKTNISTTSPAASASVCEPLPAREMCMISSGEAVAHKAHKALTGSHARTAGGSPAARVDADARSSKTVTASASMQQGSRVPSSISSDLFATATAAVPAAINNVTQATTFRQPSTASSQPLAAWSTSPAFKANTVTLSGQTNTSAAGMLESLNGTAQSAALRRTVVTSVVSAAPLPQDYASLRKALLLLPKLRLLSHPHQHCNLQKQQQHCARVHVMGLWHEQQQQQLPLHHPGGRSVSMVLLRCYLVQQPCPNPHLQSYLHLDLFEK